MLKAIKKFFFHFSHFILLLLTFYLVEYILFNNIGHRISLKFWRFDSASHLFGAILFISPFFLLNLKRKNYLIISLLIFTYFCLGSVLYFRTYQQLIPLESFFYLSNFDGLSGSIFSSFKIIDALFLIPFILLLTINWIFKYISSDIVIHFRVFLFVLYFLISIFTFKLFWNKDFTRIFFRQGSSNPFYYDQFYTAKYHGILPLWLWQIFNSNSINLSKENIKYYQKLLINTEFSPAELSIASDSTPNIILIMVESLDSWVLELKYNEKEITPNINKLIKQPGTLLVPYIISQTMGGRSSDSQLIINTGLLPLKVGAASFKSFNNEFLSFPKALKYKGYNSAIFCGGTLSFWNYYPFAKAQGFEKIIAIDDYDYNKNDVLGFGLKDSIFFAQTSVMLKSLKQPFYAQLITLSSHAPFVLKDDMVATDFCSDNTICNYLKAINYVDRAIGLFIENIITAGLYENTVIIITGDHIGNSIKSVSAFLSESENIDLKYSEHLNTIPLIILNSKKNKQYFEKYNQIDIYTTLLDLFSVDYYWYGFGKSVIENPDNNIDFNKFYDRISNMRKHHISDSLIRGNFFKHLDL